MERLISREKKVSGGKLVRVEVGVRDHVITFVSISGDFFVIPEDFIERLESSIIGLSADCKVVSKHIRNFFSQAEVDLLGFTVEDLIDIFCDILSGV